MGCPIEWVYGGDNFWYSDRLVNSAISGSNRADRPRSVGKFSLLPFQILSFAQGLRASLTQTLKNEEPSRAPPKTR